ncbi:DEAD/DEAH box helicase family protein [Priestia megaterium]
MLLDLKNNELIFSQIPNPTLFLNDIKKIDKMKHREYKGRYYMSLKYLTDLQKVLMRFKGSIRKTQSYQSFQDKFVLNKNPIVIEWEPMMCKVSGRGMPWKEIIPITSYFNQGAKNSKQYGKTWSGYTHLVDPVKGEFPSGLLERIVNVLQTNGIPFQVHQRFSYPEKEFHLNPVFSFTPTQDQIDSVTALDKANHGIAKLPTGFGKTSFVAADLIAKKGVKAMFLANQRVLTSDAKDDFDSVFRNDDIKIGVIADGEFDPGDITVASIQSIASALKPPTAKEIEVAEYELSLVKRRSEKLTPEDELYESTLKEFLKCQTRVNSLVRKLKRHHEIIPFLKTVGLFIVDEAQVLGTDQWNKFLRACPAPYRYTLSATPTRTDGGGVQIIAATGEFRYQSSASDQIQKGRLADFLGRFTKFDHKVDKKVARELKMDHHQAYDLFIVNNPKRNEHLCLKVKEWAVNNSVLALVSRLEHGEIVRNMLIDLGMREEQVHFVHGGTAKKLRKNTIEAFRNSEFPVLIGTSIFDVGFNAKNASKIVRFNAGSSEVREPQRAGRTVRMRDDGSRGESYDILDINVPYFESQGWKRYTVLKEEFGEHRVMLSKQTIEGELNVVGIQEVVSNIPDETDRLKGEEILAFLQRGDEEFEEPEEEYHLNDLEPDLQMVLDGLDMK